MQYINEHEVALFVMCRQQLVHLGAGAGKSQEELDVAAYRNMQALLNDDNLADAANQLNRAKKITEVYG